MRWKSVKEEIELFESFYKSIDDREKHKKEHFNLLSVMQLLENAHTNILWEVLKYKDNSGNHPFFESFIIDFLKLDIKMTDYQVFSEENKATQYHAISYDKKGNGNDMQNNDRKGYIDLLLKDDRSAVIIENKICGAFDGVRQLARYYYSFVQFEETDPNQENCGFLAEYKNYWESTKNNVCYRPENVYLVYLTLDGGKKPSEESMPIWLEDKLSTNGHLLLVNYSNVNNGLLKWFKEKVIQKLTNSEKDFKAIIEAYVDYVEYYMMQYNQSIVDAAQHMKLDSLFTKFLHADGEFKEFVHHILLTRLNNLMPNDWIIYQGNGFIKIYTQEWSDYGYHFELNDFQRKGFWQLHCERAKKRPSNKIQYNKLESLEIGVTELLQKNEGELESYFKDFIQRMQEIIKEVNDNLYPPCTFNQTIV